MDKKLTDVAAGRVKADLVIKNAFVADVFNDSYAATVPGAEDG